MFDCVQILQKAEKSSMESNRAVAVATNVEIRRTKDRLMEEIPKLRKLAQKKVSGNCLEFNFFLFIYSSFIYQFLFVVRCVRLNVIWICCAVIAPKQCHILIC